MKGVWDRISYQIPDFATDDELLLHIYDNLCKNEPCFTEKWKQIKYINKIKRSVC